MGAFNPSGGLTDTDRTVTIGAFWPPLSTAEARDQTGIPDAVSDARLTAVLQSSAIEVAASLAPWRATRAEPTLADVPAPTIDGESIKVVLWRTAVYAHLRSRLFDEVRDLDATRSAHLRSDTLDGSAAAWARRATEAVARLADRPRAIVELI